MIQATRTTGEEVLSLTSKKVTKLIRDISSAEEERIRLLKTNKRNVHVVNPSVRSLKKTLKFLSDIRESTKASCS